MPERHLRCPWENVPTHRQNADIRVSEDMPFIQGRCPPGDDCALCAGTGYKPNTEIRRGRPFTYVPCPYHRPDEYRKRVARMLERMQRR